LFFQDRIAAEVAKALPGSMVQDVFLQHCSGNADQCDCPGGYSEVDNSLPAGKPDTNYGTPGASSILLCTKQHLF
ncbi:hypothetical protein, partial [Marinobacter sp.]